MFWDSVSEAWNCGWYKRYRINLQAMGRSQFWSLLFF